MIVIKNRELLIPNNEQFIGTVYDNNADTRFFKIDRVLPGQIDLNNFTFVADVKYSNNATDSISLTKDSVTEDSIVLRMQLPASVLSSHVGNMAIQVRCSDTAGRTWSTAPANMYIMDQISNPGAVTSSTTLTELQQTETTIEASEALRIAAETSRANAETGRVNAESARVIAESGREIAETGRVNAESGRASAETGRANAETARGNAETGRSTAESGRVNAETGRVNAESARVLAETARETAEANREATLATKSLISEGYAKGTQNDVPVTSESPYYHDNSKYYSQQADADSLVAEGWAKGTQNGVEVTSESPYYHDNSKYYKEQAGQATVGFVSYATVQDLNATAKARARGNIDAYTKPASGIPSTDLTSAVQTSLNKADTALQEHQSLAAYRTSAAQDVIDTALNEDKADRVDVEPLINVWDETWRIGAINDSTGAYDINQTDRICTYFIKVKPSTTYYLHCTTNAPIFVYGYGSSKEFIGGKNGNSWTVGSVTDCRNIEFTTSANIYYIIFKTTGTYGATYLNDISINYPSTYHGYYPSRLAKVESRVTNRNLLDNPWWGSGEVVNQRGGSSWDYNYDYTIDRWLIGYNGDSSTITLTSGGLSFNGQIWLTQIIEPSLFDAIKGKVATISCIVDGQIVSGTAVIPSSGTTTFFENNKVKLYMEIQNGNLLCPINPKTACTIRAVKLELGTVSTLHMDTAPNYAEELLKCQRYCYVLNVNNDSQPKAYGYGYQGYLFAGNIPTPTTMKPIQTVTYTLSDIRVICNGTEYTPTGFSVHSVTASGIYFICDVSIPSNYSAILKSYSKIILSADL